MHHVFVLGLFSLILPCHPNPTSNNAPHANVSLPRPRLKVDLKIKKNYPKEVPYCLKSLYFWDINVVLVVWDLGSMSWHRTKGFTVGI